MHIPLTAPQTSLNLPIPPPNEDAIKRVELDQVINGLRGDITNKVDKINGKGLSQNEKQGISYYVAPTYSH